MDMSSGGSHGRLFVACGKSRESSQVQQHMTIEDIRTVGRHTQLTRRNEEELQAAAVA